jgi:transcription antitermination factor NusG
MHGIFGANGELQVDIDETLKRPYRWHAAVVRPGKELQTYIFLRNKKMLPYWPRYQQDVKLARHRAGVRWCSVLPGYLFIPMPIDKTIDCYLIEQAPGGLTVMRTAEHHVAELRVEEIMNIREVEEALNVSPIAAVQGIPFKVGQRVRITGKNHPAWEGPIVRIENKRRVVVEIFMLGRTVCLTVSANKLEAVTSVSVSRVML